MKAIVSITTLSLLLVTFACAFNTNGDMDLVLLPESTSPGGRCMDGSMAGYYIRDGVEDSNLFVIYLKGGGACSTEEDCDKRLNTSLGSSDYWRDTNQGTGFLDADCTQNPSFCEATAVFVNYCTGDTHRGTRTQPSELTYGYYFDGHTNFAAIIDKLITEKGLDEPDTKVLLTGGSAGGIGAIFNIDWLADKLENASVKGVPVAGWYSPAALDYDLPEPFNPSDYEHFANNENGNSIYDAYMQDNSVVLPDLWGMKDMLSEECLVDHTDVFWFACASAHYAYPYIKSSLFNVHTQYDKNQLSSQNGAPLGPASTSEMDTVKEYMEMWGYATRQSLQLIVQDASDIEKSHPDGIFSASCMTHGTSRDTLIDGHNYMEIAHDWFFQNGEFEDQYKLIESCPEESDLGEQLPCNAAKNCQYDPLSRLPPMARTCLLEIDMAGCLETTVDNEKQCLQCLRDNKREIYQRGCRRVRLAKKICKYAHKA